MLYMFRWIIEEVRRIITRHLVLLLVPDSIYFLFRKFANRALRSHLYTARNKETVLLNLHLKKSKPLGNTLKELHA